MRRSIQFKLFLSLIASACLLIAISVFTNHTLDKKLIAKATDRELMQTAMLVASIGNIDFKDTSPEATTDTNQQLQFQIWDKKHQLLRASKNAPKKPFLPLFQIGFSTSHGWRIYSTQTADHIIQIREHHNELNHMFHTLVRNNIAIILMGFPILILFIWISTRLALRSTNMLARDLGSRASHWLEPLNKKHYPNELYPLITELNRLFHHLQLAFERNRRFSADAAHELRTPLAALKTQTQLAISATNENKRQEALSMVLIAVDHCNHMVQQLLTLSRLGHDESLTDTSFLNLEHASANIIALLVPQADTKQIEMGLEVEGKNVTIEGSESAISVLIRNLLDNAIRYTPEKGEVKVMISSKNSRVILSVQDTGPGIPASQRERIFERFYRIIGTKETGSGLGLAIVKQIADLHYATIEITEPEFQQGTLINISFPMPKYSL